MNTDKSYSYNLCISAIAKPHRNWMLVRVPYHFKDTALTVRVTLQDPLYEFTQLLIQVCRQSLCLSASYTETLYIDIYMLYLQSPYGHRLQPLMNEYTGRVLIAFLCHS